MTNNKTIEDLKKENSLLKTMLKKEIEDETPAEFYIDKLEKINKIKESAFLHSGIKLKLFNLSLMLFVALTINASILSVINFLEVDLYKAVFIVSFLEISFVSFILFKKDIFNNVLLKSEMNILDRIKYLSISLIFVFAAQNLTSYFEISYLFLIILVFFIVYFFHEIHKRSMLKIINSDYHIESILLESDDEYRKSGRSALFYKTYTEIKKEEKVKNKIKKGNKKELNRLTKKDLKTAKDKLKEEMIK